MSEGFSPLTQTMLNRRSMMGGTAAGAAGLMAGMGSANAGAHAQSSALDLSDPKTNLETLLKLQADLSGEQVVGGFGGYAWMWVPDEDNYLVFGTYGIGCSRIEWNEDEQAYRFYHREVLYYTDPKTRPSARHLAQSGDGSQSRSATYLK